MTSFIISAVFITGGEGAAEQSAEIYHPDRDTPCVLPKLPLLRSDHTQDGSLMCGGRYTHRSCRRWNADIGAWDLVTKSLTELRDDHISWTLADGAETFLFGGRWSYTTSEMLQHDNNKVMTSFPLKHTTM